MAETNRRGQQSVVNGTLAYDLNSTAPEREEYGRPQSAPYRQPKVRTRTKTAPRSRQHLEPLSILGIAVAALLLVSTIVAQSRVLDVSSHSVELQQQVKELEEQQARLKVRYESAFNMADIEEYAVKSLGMQKPKADQIYYIDTSAADKAVVFSREESEDSFLDLFAELFSDFGDIF